MKAVVWTDVFQSGVMIVGLLTAAIAGVVDIGSFKKIFKVASERDRLSLNFSLDPREYHTVWGMVIGLAFSMMVGWTVGQPTVQRAVAAKTLKDARKALYASFIGIVFLKILLCLDAFIIYGTYSECDLVKSKQISRNDQILPYFVVNKLGHIPGMPGLFTACLFSFALSTLSSGLNGLSAMFSEDIVKKIKPDMKDNVSSNISKFCTVIFGSFIIGFAFVIPYLGKFIIKLTIQLAGIIGGPYFSMFALGVFTEKANKFGAVIGALSGFSTGIFFSIGQFMYPPDKQLPPISIRECSFFNATTSNSTGIFYPKAPVHTDAIAQIFAISYLWHGMIAIFVSYIVGYLISICTDKYVANKDYEKSLLYDYEDSWLYRKCCCRSKQPNRQNEFLLMNSDSFGKIDTKFEM